MEKYIVIMVIGLGAILVTGLNIPHVEYSWSTGECVTGCDYADQKHTRSWVK